MHIVQRCMVEINFVFSQLKNNGNEYNDGLYISHHHTHTFVFTFLHIRICALSDRMSFISRCLDETIKITV